jgi:hypothetical protein
MRLSQLFYYIQVMVITLLLSSHVGAAINDKMVKTPRRSGITLFTDDFSGYENGSSGSPPWNVYWGNAKVTDRAYLLYSVEAKSYDETYSALSALHAEWRNYRVSLMVKTEKQLRSSMPNPWEVAWILFRFRDIHNFYYFILKTNGIELGKRENGDFFGPSSQIFLYTRDSPTLRLGEWYNLRIEALNINDSAVRIRVWINAEMVIDYLDAETILLYGGIALYVEDAVSAFDDVIVEKI